MRELRRLKVRTLIVREKVEEAEAEVAVLLAIEWGFRGNWVEMEFGRGE